MNIEKLADEADKAFSSGNILSLPKSKLIEYIQALSCINTTGTDDRLKKSTQAQSLNTIYNVKVINELNLKNTILTWVVIFLAISTLALSLYNLYLVHKF